MNDNKADQKISLIDHTPNTQQTAPMTTPEAKTPTHENHEHTTADNRCRFFQAVSYCMGKVCEGLDAILTAPSDGGPDIGLGY